MNKKDIVKLIKESAAKVIESIFSGYIYTRKFLFNKNRIKEDKNKVLVICNDHIGDTVVRIEYLNEFIRRYGYENVFFVSSKVNADVIKLISQNVIVYDSTKYRNSFKYKLELFKKLNSENFYSVVSLVPFRRHQSDIISNLVICKSQVLFNEDDGECEYVLNPLTELMNKVFNGKYKNEDFKPNLKRFLRPIETNITLPESYIVLGMGADSKQRMYPAEQFKEIVEYLLKKNHNIVFLGRGNKDIEFINELQSYIDLNNSNIYNLINKTSLNDTLNIISKAECFLGVESGLWNCAYCLNTKSVVIYGGGHWGRFKHESNDIGYAYVDMKCFNCNWECIYDDSVEDTVSCIRQIRPEVIIEELAKKGV